MVIPFEKQEQKDYLYVK